MLCQRLSAWFSADHNGILKDVLSGRERILPLVDPRRYPCRTLSAYHFAALNFVRVAFKHMSPKRTRGSPSSSIVQLLSTVMERHVLEAMLSPCELLTSEQPVQLEEMRRIPLFDGTLRHVATKHGHPSMILFKQSLRQMQLHPSPISAMVVSRSTSATVCLRLREHFKDVFFVLDFAPPPPEHGYEHGTTLALVVNTSLEQTAARLSRNLPMDNHFVTRDRQWQAQLSASCTMCIFMPAEGVFSSETESLAINESVGLLRIMGEIDDQGGGRDVNRSRKEERRRGDQQSGASRNELWERTPFPSDVSGIAVASRNLDSHMVGRSVGEGPSTQVAEPHPKAMFALHEQNKRHCQIFFSDDDSSSSTSSGSISLWSESSDGDAHFECAICFESMPETAGIRLLPCAHGFCRDCLVGHVCSKIDERKFPVFCPLCIIEQGNANPSVVSGEMLRRLGVPEAWYAIWSELEMSHLYARVHCRRCNRSAFIDRERYEQSEELSCPFQGCGYTWCRNCRQSLPGNASGPKHSCDGTEELDYLVKQMGWKYCPKCRTPVQKNGGCNHMTCATPGCNTHFCYRCGKQITRASIPFLVRSAVNAHFKQCTL